MTSYKNTAVGYCRASRDGVGLTGQRKIVLQYAERKNLKVDSILCVSMPKYGENPELERDQLVDLSRRLGLVLVPDLSRLGLNIADALKTISLIHETGAELIIINKDIRLRADIELELPATLLLDTITLLEQERVKLLSVRTEIMKAETNPRGRPRGKLGVSRLDGREAEIQLLFKKGLTRARIADVLGVSRTAFYHFLDTRNIILKSRLQQHAQLESDNWCNKP
ncbi:recombinase family protein [Pseudovibrio sp. POLY-S9]|uniref:recombinase family protein n=1 Tax=Pseudovibrio sp. POLY-S9 TaxID=1576596 RepID=UPI0007100A8D|nr:recombinase family protein [Pseudovibrio sp. POLY-S9]